MLAAGPSRCNGSGLAGAVVGVLWQMSNVPTADTEVLQLFDNALSDMATLGGCALVVCGAVAHSCVHEIVAVACQRPTPGTASRRRYCQRGFQDHRQ